MTNRIAESKNNVRGEAISFDISTHAVTMFGYAWIDQRQKKRNLMFVHMAAQPTIALFKTSFLG